MDISVRFNRFYHSVLNDLYQKSQSLQIRDLKDTRTGGAFRIWKHEHYCEVEEELKEADYSTVDELKQCLKILNVNYAVDEEKDKKVSTKDVDNKELLNHIEWMVKVSHWNSIELDFVQKEWEYLINYYKG